VVFVETKKRKTLSRTVWLTLLWVLLAAVVASAATYAWFTFSPYTNVEPMSSTISQGGANLLISNSSSGTFDTTCALTPDSSPQGLIPLSTADLTGFYAITAQTTDGIAMLYKTVEDTSSYLIHGTVYLKSVGSGCDVYFNQNQMGFGADSQALAALRLGLRLTTQTGAVTYIFRLDDMGSTASAASTVTVPTANTVVSALSGTTASYVTDPAKSISAYAAKMDEADAPQAGTNLLTSLQADEIATVEYWLYLEGCDENCINDVQNRDFSLQLAFVGVEQTETETQTQTEN
jgi:hypothetical protein